VDGGEEGLPWKGFLKNHHLHSLKLTANAPENRVSPKGNQSSKHPFSGANCWFQGDYLFVDWFF